MNYLGNKYTDYNLTSRFGESSKIIEELNARRLGLANPIPEKAEKAHIEVLGEIKTFFSDDTIERKVFCSPFIEEVGCLVALDDKKSHLLMRDDVAKFYTDSGNYEAFKELNPNGSPKNFFMNAVAHEYGHIMFSAKIEPRIKRATFSYGFNNCLGLIPLEIDEAFAFCVGDILSGFKSPLEALSYGYKRNGVDFDKTIGAYNEFNELILSKGKEEFLKIENIAPIIDKYQQKLMSKKESAKSLFSYDYNINSKFKFDGKSIFE